MENQLFDKNQFISIEYSVFLKNTELGKLYSAIPFAEIIEKIPPSIRENKKNGPNSRIGIKGGVALMFLKSYTSLSDKKLVERLNTDYAFQLFCGIRLKPGEWIHDEDLVGRWRRLLAPFIEANGYKEIQEALAASWKSNMEETFACFMDATCYESSVRFPTDVKLLWESCRDLNRLISGWGKRKGYSHLTKLFEERSTVYLGYSKSRKKTYKATQKQKKSLLNLLEKMLSYVKIHRADKEKKVIVNHWFSKRIETIETVFLQQKAMYESGEKSVKDRIVSLSKPYVRPIVRGKETKRVEFGAKVHKMQVNGISFIERIDFDAFNEGTLLQNTVALHNRLFDKCTILGADAIYATNANRSYCSDRKMATNFVPKGKRPADATKNSQASKMRELIGKERATVLEGSFGTEKEHYNLKTIKAKRKDTEMLWICFGIWTCSAMKIARRIAAQGFQKNKAA